MGEKSKPDKVIQLKIKNPKRIYQELVRTLEPYRDEQRLSIEFIIEGTKKKPLIGIRYPGRKMFKRELKRVSKNSALWANLFDFLVVPYLNGKPLKENEFTFQKILKDFEENKRESAEFWNLIEQLYKTNEIKLEVPKLSGIPPKLFLLVLKWIWIQEDFNYKLSWKDVGSSTMYVLESRTGSRVSRGAGRAKFYAALILLKHNFTFEEIKKIIPLY